MKRVLSNNESSAKESKIASKLKFFYTCHPDDFYPFIDILSDDLFKSFNCEIYYADDYSVDLSNEIKKDKFDFFIVPVTKKFLSKPNRARDFDLVFAISQNITILPIMFTEKNSNNICELWNKYFQRIAKPYNALEYIAHSYSFCCDKLGEKNKYTIRILNDLSYLYESIGEIEKALSFLKKFIEQRQRIITNETIESIKESCNYTNNIKEEVDLFLFMTRLVLGTNSVDYLERQYNLERVILGDRDIKPLYTLEKIAEKYVSLSNYAKGKELYEKLYTEFLNSFGIQHVDTLSSLFGLACCSKEIGELKYALECFENYYKYSTIKYGDDNSLLIRINEVFLQIAEENIKEIKTALKIE